MLMYLFRKVSERLVQIAKFEDRSLPTSVYELDLRSKRCSCPSPRTPCKHWALVQEWLALGGPIPSQILDRQMMEEFLNGKV